MHVFEVAFYASGAYYAIFVERGLLLPFIAVVVIYLLISSFFLKGAKDISIRKKVMLASWTEPTEGIITMRVPVRTEKVREVIEREKEKRLTYTHFALKAVSVLLTKQPDLNGKLSFGKFVPYDSVDISCLVDLDGKDLAAVCIKGVDKMSIEDIASFIREKAGKAKKSDGGEEHKKRTGPLKFFPAFIISAITEVVGFITMRLGISLKFMGFERHGFGAACVTSLGMLGFQDATAPFTGFANCTMFVSVNGVSKTPVVEGDKIVVGEVMNCNFAVDHRYIDGGKCKQLIPAFRHVFEHPQQYMDSHLKKGKTQ